MKKETKIVVLEILEEIRIHEDQILEKLDISDEYFLELIKEIENEPEVSETNK